jgi:hypothetical protein
MIDLEELIEKRVEAILGGDSSLYSDYAVMDGDGADWGVIAIMSEDDHVLRYEFVESELSWMRPEAIDEYNEAADREVPVTVIVPSEAFLAVSVRVQKYGSRDISVFGYEAVLLRVKGLPP